MKKIVILFSLALLFFACNGKKEKVNAEKSVAQSVDEVVANAEANVGKTVFIKGLVNHTCKHSGRRCFLVNDDESLSIRVEAGGDIKSFDQELIGAVIKVKGVLQEKKLTSVYIDEFEAKVKAEEGTEEGGEHCNAQMNNIRKMRKWMKEHEKEYYPIYFIEGESYEVVE